MKLLVGLISLISLLSFVVTFQDKVNNHLSDWASHMGKHGLKFNSKAEHDKRQAIFSKVHDSIQRHNSAGRHTYNLTHNKFSHLTKEEISQTLLGGVPISSSMSQLISQMTVENNSNLNSNSTSSPQERDVPLSFDLRTTPCGKQIPIKNQNPCGCCWAFAAIAPIEYANCVANSGTYTQLSEQHLVDCDPFSNGCNGGDPYSAFFWLRWFNNGVVNTASSYPFTAKSGTCIAQNAKQGATLKSFMPIFPYNPNTTVSAMQDALINHGVLSACFLVDGTNPKSIDPVTGRPLFLNYGGGVFTDPGCVEDIQKSGIIPTGNHCASIVGWGTLNGMDYWILRNQWGTSWGVGGYMYIQRGTNMCGIESMVSYVMV